MAAAVAEALTEYCAANTGVCVEENRRRRRRLLATQYQASDVDFLLVQESGVDLEIYTWVWEPSLPGNGVEQDVLRSALDEHKETVTDVMDDPEFNYSTRLPVVDAQGLEAWSIALIIAATILLLIAIVGYFECRSRKKTGEDAYLVDADEIDGGRSRTDTGSTPREAEEGAASQAKSPLGPETDSEEQQRVETDSAEQQSNETDSEEQQQMETDSAEQPNMETINQENTPQHENIPLQEKTNKDSEDYDQGIQNKGYENDDDELTKL